MTRNDFTPTIFALRHDRLGGRLSAILNAWRISQRYGFELKIRWNRSEIYTELQRPEEVFDEAFIEAHFLPEGTGRGVGKIVDFGNVPRLSTEDWLLKEAAQTAFGFTGNSGVQVLPWEDPAEARASFARAFASLGFKHEVRSAFVEAETRLTELGDSVVAIHLRRGDIIRVEQTGENWWPGRYVPDAFYRAALDRVMGDGDRLVLFCDDDEVLGRWLDDRPDAVGASALVSNFTLPGLQRDIVELYLMSRCRAVIAPGQSAFSVVAGDIGPVERLPVREAAGDGLETAVREVRGALASPEDYFLNDLDAKQSVNYLAALAMRDRDRRGVMELADRAAASGSASSHVLKHAAVAAFEENDQAVFNRLEGALSVYPYLNRNVVGTVAGLSVLNAIIEDPEAVPLHELQSLQFVGSDHRSLLDALCLALWTGKFEGLLPPHAGDPNALHTARPRFQVPHRALRSDAFSGAFEDGLQPSRLAGLSLLFDWPEFIDPAAKRTGKAIFGRPHQDIPEFMSSDDDNSRTLRQVLLKIGAQTTSPWQLNRMQLAHDGSLPDDVWRKRMANVAFARREDWRGFKLLTDLAEEEGANPYFMAALVFRRLERGQFNKANIILKRLQRRTDAEHVLGHPALTNLQMLMALNQDSGDPVLERYVAPLAGKS